MGEGVPHPPCPPQPGACPQLWVRVQGLCQAGFPLRVEVTYGSTRQEAARSKGLESRHLSLTPDRPTSCQLQKLE